MIDTLPMQHPPLLQLHTSKVMQTHQPHTTATSSGVVVNVAALSPSLVAKNADVDAKIKTSLKPWRVTPPLKKRHVRISLPQVVDDEQESSSSRITIDHLVTTTKTLLKEQKTTKKIIPIKAKKSTIAKKTMNMNNKKSVRFSKVIKTRTLKKERTANLTPIERGNMWYQNREYAEMDRECSRDVQAYIQVGGDLSQLPPNEYCLRGLEMKTSPHIHRLRLLRANITVRAVLDQQNYVKQQRLLLLAGVGVGCNNSSSVVGEESIARVSRQYTQQAQNRARELGLIDSIEAKRSYQS